MHKLCWYRNKDRTYQGSCNAFNIRKWLSKANPYLVDSGQWIILVAAIQALAVIVFEALHE